MDGSSPNNRIVYRIQRGASDKFVIDSLSGLVSVANGSNLDPDRTDPKITKYTLTVVSKLYCIIRKLRCEQRLCCTNSRKYSRVHNIRHEDFDHILRPFEFNILF